MSSNQIKSKEFLLSLTYRHQFTQ